MTNVYTDSSVSSIASGTSYNAKITAANGYHLISVMITMGGADITNSAYHNGIIHITSVTGNIVIIATAMVDTSTPYTNLVPASIDINGNIYNGIGYKTDYRLNSSGLEIAQKGSVVSGLIPYHGEIIRAYGTTNGTVGNSGNYIVCYDSNFNKTFVHSFHSAVNGGATWESIDGKYLLTLDPTASAQGNYFANAAYIRIGFASMADAEYFIVTLNESIK